MKAMVVPNWGEKSVLMSQPDPKPSSREAVMRVRAAGVGLTLLNMDVSDEKCALAREWGADEAINVKKEGDLVAAVKRLTDGRGVDVGHSETFQVAYDSLSTSGRAVVIGVGKGSIQVPTRPLMSTEKTITGSRHSTRTELIETLEVMARGVVKPVVGMRTHFTEIENIFEAIVDEKLLGRGALTYD